MRRGLTPLVDILVRGSCVRATTTCSPTVGCRGFTPLVDTLLHLVQRPCRCKFCGILAWSVVSTSSMLHSVRATVRWFPEGMLVRAVIGARPPSRREGVVHYDLDCRNRFGPFRFGSECLQSKCMHHAKHFLGNV